MKVLLFDFSSERATQSWMPINDVVMGGVSCGQLRPSGHNTAAFAGTVSLESGGGFASIRSRDENHDLRDFAGLEIRVCGDGRRYKLNLRTDQQASNLLYAVAFESLNGAWQTLRIPFEQFLPTSRGRLLANAPALDRSRVSSFGLMISDRQAGPFRLEVAEISAYAY